MSKYTTEVRFICENYAGLTESTGYGKIEEIIASAREKVFDFTYPIFDETYRSVLETKILRHYYTKEIGLETVGLWKHFLNTKMNEIMPYYNRLYESELYKFNPLYNVDIKTTHKGSKAGSKEDTGEMSELGSIKGTQNGKVNGTATSVENDTTNVDRLDTYADTPQGAVTNLETNEYLTNARKIVDGTSKQSNNSATSESTTLNTTDNTTQSSSTSKLVSAVTDTEEYLDQVCGKQGGESYSKMLNEYRATFLNIDMLIIDELSGLFMNLW